MSPTTMASEPTDEEPDEPRQFVTHEREKIVERFVVAGRRDNINYDVDQNIREIRALLKINSEIFGRCTSSATIHKSGDTALFTRRGFSVVKMRRGHQDQGATQTQFITELERSQLTFSMRPLSTLPEGLEDMIVAKKQAAPFNMFVDYDVFFRSAIGMLHDDILAPFLSRLKSQIESIHVCLGKIEAWLLEPNEKIEFLEATFGEKLDLPTADDLNDGEFTHPAVTRASSDVCFWCNRHFSEHKSEYRGLSYVPPSQRVDKHYCFSGKSQTFMGRKVFTLKTCNEPGTYERTFSIARQGDRTKLEKFLEFIAC